MAAAFRRMTNVFRNSHFSPAQFFFCRGFSCKLMVKGLSFTTTDESLTEAFKQFGELLDANIVRDKATNKPKGYGFVTFETEEDAEKALISMNGKLLDQRAVSVIKPGRSKERRRKE